MPLGGALTAMLIGAGTGIASAAIQSHQAGKAVQAQTTASDKALALQQQVLAQQQANLAPFRSAGVNALGPLQKFLGIDAIPGGGDLTPSAPRVGLSSPESLGLMGPGDVPPPNPIQQGVPGIGSTQIPQGGSLQTNSGQQPLAPASTSSYPGYRQMTNSIPNLRVKGPDGTIRLVPANLVNQAVANGGTVLGEAA